MAPVSASPAFYEKANSFLEIRQDARDYENVYERVRRLRDALDEKSYADYQARIIRQACDNVSEVENGHIESPWDTGWR